MRPGDLRTRLGQLCTTHLGPDMGPRVAALARNGFTLVPASDDAGPSGRFRFGGPALLEPDTPWPTFEGTPMPLLAVMDTDALAPWLDVALPPGSGLLNVFYIGHEEADIEPDISASQQVQFEAPLDWRVLPADPTAAVETPPPVEGIQLPVRPVHAEPIVALPDSTRAHNPPSPHAVNDAELWEAFLRIQERLPEIAGEEDTFSHLRNLPAHLVEDTDDGHRAFGWPWVMQGDPTPDTSRVHLLQLDTDDGWTWADCGMISLDIPAEALRAGDFSQVDCSLASC